MDPVSAVGALNAAQILAFHDKALAVLGEPAPSDAGVWEAIAANHRHNCALWAEEDLARRRNVPDAEIAANKRAIDVHNQKRNDAIERIDEMFLSDFSDVNRASDARLNSETAGAMVDRLSILSLKIHHMRLQTERQDVDEHHRQTCRAKLGRLVEQRTDLAACLDRLLREVENGTAYFKLYRQFKMYNDPSLNPALYAESKKPS
ncbi:MAG TPA: DUF4254 domain-containing protein [Burkholderiales bacterium]|nr:DUF4254 domain-containing protein [Burkholderiales bacterium]